jgi:hypothetical protein
MAAAAAANAPSVRAFQVQLDAVTLNAHLVLLKESFYLWVGSGADMQSLAVALQTALEAGPTATSLLPQSGTAEALSAKLSARTKQMAMVSYNVANSTPELELAVLRRVFDELMAAGVLSDAK